MSKSHKHIVEEAAEYGNVAESLDYELRGSRGQTWAGRWIRAHRETVIRATQSSILGGTLRPGRYRNLTVKERGKTRQAQSITLLRSIGIHAVMKVVEARITPTFIADSAASIKGRGGTYLIKRLLHALHSDPAGTRYVYKDDLTKFYQSIDQDLMMQVIRRTFRDRRLVRILERWIRMLAEGVSIGMRPSQGMANLLLSIFLDHVLKDGMGARHYQRYCDDKAIESGSPYALTALIRATREQTQKAGLSIKPNAQVWDWEKRPVDFLGYVVYHDGRVAVRKHIKQRFARKWRTVRSRRRRRELIGSFYGVAKHAHARHLFRKITGLDMTTFAELGFVYQRDGKKDFPVERISLRRLVNTRITVEDFETDIKTKEGDGRYVVLFSCQEIGKRKFFTNNDKMKQALDYMKAHGNIPFESTIKRDGKYGYMFT